MRSRDRHDRSFEMRACPEENDRVAEPLISYWLALDETADPSAPRRREGDPRFGWVRARLTQSLRRLARLGLSDLLTRQRRFNASVRDAFAETVVELSALQRRLDLLELERDQGHGSPPATTAS